MARQTDLSTTCILEIPLVSTDLNSALEALSAGDTDEAVSKINAAYDRLSSLLQTAIAASNQTTL